MPAGLSLSLHTSLGITGLRIVVIGAGVLGSLYGARLAIAGQSVTLVARGGRLAELQRGPILILNEEDGITAAATVAAVLSLKPDDDYALALVVVRADQIDDLLPQLAANRGVKAFLFMHNRAAGSSALAQAVGPERLLLCFPGAGGWLDGATVRYRLIPSSPPHLASQTDGFRLGCAKSRKSSMRLASRSNGGRCCHQPPLS